MNRYTHADKAALGKAADGLRLPGVGPPPACVNDPAALRQALATL
jgi:hypothetical protein